MSAQLGDQWRIAQAERIRDAMGPDMCAVADALREKFGAKLVWFESGEFTMGKPLQPSEPIGERSRNRKREVA